LSGKKIAVFFIRKSFHPAVIPAFMLVVGLVLSGLAAYYVTKAKELERSKAFGTAVQDFTHEIERRVEACIALLRGGSGLFSVSENVTAEDFRTYVNRLRIRQNYPGIQGIGYSVRIQPEDVNQFTDRMVAQGFEWFSIWPEDPGEENHFIIYLEPLDRRNQVAIGYNMYADPVRAEAMARARDGGQSAASGRVRLVQEIEDPKQPGFLIYSAVYQGGKIPETVEERREKLLGFVFSPYRSVDFFMGILSPKNKALDLAVYDGVELKEENLLFKSNDRITSKEPESTVQMEVAGRIWTLAASLSPDHPYAQASLLTPLIAGIGALVSCLLAFLIYSEGTTRKALEETEQAIRESEERFRTMADTAPAMIWTSGTDQGWDYCSKPWLEFTGRTMEQESGMGWLEGVHPEDAAKCLKIYSAAFEARKRFAMEYRLRRYDGEYRWIVHHGAPRYTPEGTFTGYTGACIDITERKNAETLLSEAQGKLKLHAADLEREVAERTAKLQEAIAELEAFSYTVSHDLRSPLRAMQGYSHVLLEDYSQQLDEEARDYLKRINKAGSRLDKLIQDMLRFSRVARESAKIEPVSLDELVGDILEQYPAFQPPEGCIQVTKPLGTVQGNAMALTQCLSNLFGNAIKFVAPGVVPRIEVRTEFLGEKIRLWVEDNGIGIHPDHQQRIFNMFERLSPESDYEGTGIGLAIVKKAVERMSGRVGIISEMGKGSRFWIELPRAE
jgi:PAS domain S-box-containing protein